MELRISDCCDAPVNTLFKGTSKVYACSKCGDECKPKKSSKPFVHKRTKK